MKKSKPFYHEGARALQDEFDSRRLADRLEETRVRQVLTDEDRAYLGRCSFFFLATADREGRPDCSYKGGNPGFVKVVGPSELAFPSYDGNGMYRSLGNISVNPHVGMLFVDFQRPSRMRVNGLASLHLDDPLQAEYAGAELVVRVRVREVFPNCPRYIHQMELVKSSEYVPKVGHSPPRPKWKDMEDLRDVLPARDRVRSDG